MSVKTLYQVGNASDKVAQYKYLNTIKITITSDDDNNNYYIIVMLIMQCNNKLARLIRTRSV